MNPRARVIKEQQQLLHLRSLREDRARQAREAVQHELDHLLQQRTEHEQRWHALCAQRHALGLWVQDAGASAMPLLNPYRSARREDLDELCERAEYDVIDDDEMIAEARTRLAQAQQAWVHACAQRQAVQEMLQGTRGRARVEAELKQEREAA